MVLIALVAVQLKASATVMVALAGMGTVAESVKVTGNNKGSQKWKM